MRLKGKIAVVTGASRGIGRAIALRLARDGALVCVNFHSNTAAAQAVVGEVEATGGEAFALQAVAKHPVRRPALEIVRFQFLDGRRTGHGADAGAGTGLCSSSASFLSRARVSRQSSGI